MITFSEAQNLLKSYSIKLKTTTLKTCNSLGAYLASDIYAPMDLPPFDNSAVDGFALKFQDFQLGQSLPIAAELRAVSQDPYELRAKSCARIMTGAPLPAHADVIIMKEDACELDCHVSFKRAPILGAHIRKRGEDIKQGELVAQAGQRLRPQHIGVLLGLGINNILVYKMPRVSVICTGDELVDPAKTLDFGQVYFLIGSMLKSQCQDFGIEDIKINKVPDDLASIMQAIEQSFDSDLIILTGGMSKGEYDLVPKALSVLGVQEIFYQGYWRPGKPLYFGRSAQSFVFGLPGNPVASFVGLRVFVQYFLNFALGRSDEPLKVARLTHDFNKASNFVFFARALLEKRNQLSILQGQGSHEIFSLSKANALCYLPAGIESLQAGTELSYWDI